MSGYFASLVAAGAVVSLALTVAYREDKVQKSVLMILLLYVCSVPLINAARDFNPDELFFDFNYEYENEYGDAFGEMSCEAFERGIRAYIADEYSLDSANISVSVTGYDEKNVRAERVTVILSGEARYADFRAIKQKLEKNGLGECEVKIAF